MARITRRPLARQDLVEIWSFIADDNDTAADGLLDRIDRVLSMLADNPRAGRARPELHAGLRSFSVGNDVVFYFPAAGGIDVVRVLSGYLDFGLDDFDGR